MAGVIGYKYVTVAKLRELLAGLPDDWQVSARTLADTGNLPLVFATVPVGVIDLHEERVDIYDREDAAHADSG